MKPDREDRSALFREYSVCKHEGERRSECSSNKVAKRKSTCVKTRMRFISVGGAIAPSAVRWLYDSSRMFIKMYLLLYNLCFYLCTA